MEIQLRRDWQECIDRSGIIKWDPFLTICKVLSSRQTGLNVLCWIYKLLHMILVAVFCIFTEIFPLLWSKPNHHEWTTLLLLWFEETPHILQFRSNYQKGEKRIGLNHLSPWVPECLLKCPLTRQGENTKPVKS